MSRLHTPFFPAFRARQATFAQLQEHLRDFLPAHLLAAEDEGPNSRDRVFTPRLTCECFLWQVLKPETACREVVRHVQALLRLHGRPPVDESDSACVQARQRLPRERLAQALTATAQAADRRAGAGGDLQRRLVKVADGSTTQLPDPAHGREGIAGVSGGAQPHPPRCPAARRPPADRTR